MGKPKVAHKYQFIHIFSRFSTENYFSQKRQVCKEIYCVICPVMDKLSHYCIEINNGALLGPSALSCSFLLIFLWWNIFILAEYYTVHTAWRANLWLNRIKQSNTMHHNTQRMGKCSDYNKFEHVFFRFLIKAMSKCALQSSFCQLTTVVHKGRILN